MEANENQLQICNQYSENEENQQEKTNVCLSNLDSRISLEQKNYHQRYGELDMNESSLKNYHLEIMKMYA